MLQSLYINFLSRLDVKYPKHDIIYSKVLLKYSKGDSRTFMIDTMKIYDLCSS